MLFVQASRGCGNQSRLPVFPNDPTAFRIDIRAFERAYAVRRHFDGSLLRREAMLIVTLQITHAPSMIGLTASGVNGSFTSIAESASSSTSMLPTLS